MLRRVLFFIIFCSIACFAAYYLAKAKTEKRVTPKPEVSIKTKTIPAEPSIAEPDIKKPIQSLHDVLNPIIQDVDGEYAIAVKNLSNGESFYYNDEKQFKSASLYKLWVMAVVYEQIQNENIDKETGLSDNIASLFREFNYDTRSEGITSGNIKITVEDALKNMISYSDNISALLLTKKVGFQAILDFLQEHQSDLSNFGSAIDTPVTTAKDVKDFLEQLYFGELANETYTTEMLDLLKGQTKNGKIPLNLPEDTKIAHKTGELNQYSHDAGIVFNSKGDYIIVVMSKTSDLDKADGVIADISDKVYEYFTN